MINTLVSLREVSAQLDIPPHVIVYAIITKKIAEPLHISGRRMFAKKDIDTLRDHFNQQRNDRWGRRANGAN